jgi:hypothetical protein
MAARRRKPRSKAWAEVPLDAPGEPWWQKVGGLLPLEGNVFAVNVDFVSLALLEAHPSGKPTTLSVPKLHQRPFKLQYLPEWPLLAVFSEESLELLDVTDPRRPTRRMLFEYEVGHERAVASIDQDLYVTHENGVAWLDPQSGKPEHLFDVPNDEFFGSYPTALTAAGQHLYVVGRDAGLHVYRRTGRGEFSLVRSTRRGYAPTTCCTWWAPGVLVLSGNEDVIAIDTSVPEKAALQKSCKLPKLELESALCRLNETEAFVAGPSLSTGDLVAASLDFSDPLSPRVRETDVLGDPALDWHSSHAIRVGDQVFAGSEYLERLHVFRRTSE